jgi:phosphatidylserine decarboxylase
LDLEDGRVKIPYFDRLSGGIQEEEVFESGAMRFLYRNPLGRLVSEIVVKRAFFSRLYAKGKNSPRSRAAIGPFIYGIDASEFEEKPESFSSFNDFFVRRLKPGARPLAVDPLALVSVADAKVLALPIGENAAFPVKGREQTLRALVAGGMDVSPWTGGIVLVFRLCPADHHRFHYFDDCAHGPVSTVPGYFHSVSPIALESGAKVLGGNRRQWTLLSTAGFGEVIEIEVAALTVNGLVQHAPSGGSFRRGQEKGFFQYGGSTIVLAFKRGAALIDADILRATARGMETRVRALSTIGKKGGFAP